MKASRKKFIGLILIFFCVVLIGIGNAKADTLFSDNFNTENGAVQLDNYSNFVNWDVTRGSVDIITHNPTFHFLGSGVYVDLDGSTWSAGKMETKTTFALLPGDYTLEFVAAGNNRGRPSDIMTVSIGNIFSETLTIQPTDPLNNYLFLFNVVTSTTGKIVFDHQGNDNCGIIIDDITLNGTTRVPEPTTMLLLGLGLVGLAGLRKHMKDL